MSKLCKSCGNYYEGDHCDKCGYGDPNLKTHAADKSKKHLLYPSSYTYSNPQIKDNLFYLKKKSFQ